MEQPRRNLLVVGIIIGLLSLMAGAVAGAVAGGLAGYMLGRREASSPQLQGRLDQLESEVRDLQQRLGEGRLPETPQGEEPAPLPWGQLPGLQPWSGGQLPSVNVDQPGALVTEVVAGTAADEAGLKPGDLIVAVDNDQVGLQATLTELVAQHQAGDKVELQVLRNGETLHLQVTLGENPDQPGNAYLGVRVLNLGTPAGKEQ